MRAVALSLALCSCATAAVPHINERPVGDFTGDWFGDRGPTVLEVHNPLDHRVDVRVACPSSDPWSEGVAYWDVRVRAHGSVSALIRELDRDSRDQTCWVHGWQGS